MSEQRKPMSREVALGQDTQGGIARHSDYEGTLYKIWYNGGWLTVDEQIADRARLGTTFFKQVGNKTDGWQWVETNYSSKYKEPEFLAAEAALFHKIIQFEDYTHPEEILDPESASAAV